MKNSNPWSRLVLAAIMMSGVLMSCEKVIDITIPDKERKIVLNGYIRANQPVLVNLSRSLSVLEKDSMMLLSGADLKLFSGTGLMGVFKEDSAGYYSLPDFLPQVGQTYRATASAGELKPVEASAVLPALVPIASVDTATLFGDWGQQELRLTVKFDDPGGIPNVYSFGVDVSYKEFDYQTMQSTGKMLTHPVYLYSSSNDMFLKDESTNFEGKLYFEDLLFDGLSKTVEFGINDYSFYESDTVWLTVKMEQIDPSFYKYVQSYVAYQNARGNPFAEPVQVFSNVKNGYGIFSGSSTSEYTFIMLGMRKFK